ncbi:Ribosomal RNA small subunit methyltransferase A [Gammaproteobacteria bacterium]
MNSDFSFHLATPRKRFGQHFLHDPGVLARIIAAINPKLGENVIEIGPGRGALTLPLLREIGRLEAIELDRDLIPYLQKRCAAAGELIIHQADALSFDFSSLTSRGMPRLVGNLPYNVATPLLFHILDQLHPTELSPGPPRMIDMHFMLQREVVDRLVAHPGESSYGRLSVMIQSRCRVERLFTVSAGAFHPPPRVESAVARLLPHAIPPVVIADYLHFEYLVRQVFSQRRKTVRNTLRGLLTDSAIESAGVDPSDRPEVLSMNQFARLTQEWSASLKRNQKDVSSLSVRSYAVEK